MNKESSRSHWLFFVKLERKNLKTYEVQRSTLNIVDLAGSENNKKTNVKGV